MTESRTALTTLAMWLCVTAIAALTIPVAAQTVRHDASTFSEYLPLRYGGASNIDTFTGVQGMQPTAAQRVTNYDGTSRLGNGIGAVLSTREVGHAVEGGQSSAIVDGINLATGSWVGQLPGIDLPAAVPWTVGVAYNSVGGRHSSHTGYHGRGWSQISQPELFFYTQSDDPEFLGTADNANDVVYVVFGTGRYAAYKRHETDSEFFVGVNGVGGVVEQFDRSGSIPEMFVLTDQVGQEFHFFGFDTDTGQAKVHGQLWKKIATDGEAAYVYHETDIPGVIANGYDSSGRILEAYDSSGREFEYTYTSGLLTQVVAKVGASVVGQVDYSYYTSSSAYHTTDGPHPTGSLRSVTRTTPMSGTSPDLDRVEYIRYDNADGGDFVAQVVSSEGVWQANEALNSSGSLSPSTLDNELSTDLQVYSDIAMTYGYSATKSPGYVASYFTNGDCGCAGSSSDETVEIWYGTDPDLPYYIPSAVTDVTLAKDDEYLTKYALDPGGMPMFVESDELPGDEAGDPETEPCVSKCYLVMRRNGRGEITGVEVRHTSCDDNDKNNNGIDDDTEAHSLFYSHCETFCGAELVYSAMVPPDSGTIPSVSAYATLYRFHYEWDCDEFDFRPVADLSKPLEELMPTTGLDIVNGVITIVPAEVGSGEDCESDALRPFNGDSICDLTPQYTTNMTSLTGLQSEAVGLPNFGQPPTDYVGGFCLCKERDKVDITKVSTGCGCPGNIDTVVPQFEYEYTSNAVFMYYNYKVDPVTANPGCSGYSESAEGRLLYAMILLHEGFSAGDCTTCDEPNLVIIQEQAEEAEPNPVTPINEPTDPFLIPNAPPIEDDGDINDYPFDSTGVEDMFRGHPDFLPSGTPLGGELLSRNPLSSRTSISGNTTDYTYNSWYSNQASLRPKQVTSSRQAVSSGSTGRNGSGSSNETMTYYRDNGTVAFVQHPDGRVDYMEYNDDLQMVESVTDVTTADTAVSSEALSDFGLSLPTSGAHLKTIYAHDDQGRIDTITSSTGRVSKMVYGVFANGHRVQIHIPRVDGTTHYGPASVTVSDMLGRTVQSGSIAIPSGGSASPSSWIDWTDSSLTDTGAVAVGTLASLSEMEYDGVSGRVTKSRVYHDLDAVVAADGYDETLYFYDDRNRRVKTVDPTGTIDRVVYDNRNRPIAMWTGTSDTSWDDTSGGGDMVKVAETVYDEGDPHGPGLVTKRTLYPDGHTVTSTERVTEYLYDSRRRLRVVLNPDAPHTVISYDAADRPVLRASYSSKTGLTLSTNPATATATRISLEKTLYDERDRVYETTVYGIDRTSLPVSGRGGILEEPGGAAAQAFVSRRWYHENGRVAKTTGTSVSKMAYDEAGRLTEQYLLADDLDSGSYTDSVGGINTRDIVLSQTRTIYDTKGRARTTIGFERKHDKDETVLGSLEDGDTTFSDDTNARVSVSSVWYDDWDRVTHAAVYGTVGSLPTYGATPPSSSATVLVSETKYDDAGRVYESVDAEGTITRMEHDDLGRTIAVIENYDDGTPGPGADVDRKTSYAYTDGHQTSMTAHQIAPLPDQTTEYVYGVPKGTGPGQSVIASNRLLYTAKYPDEVATSGTKVVTNAYDALGAPIETEDQAGNVLETTYDKLGRPTELHASTIVTGFDATVDTIETVYDDLGQVTTVTQKDGSTVLDQVAYTFDDWGQLTTIEQDYDGVVGAGGQAHVAIDYTHEVVHDGVADGWQGIARTERTITGPGATGASQRVVYDTGTAGSLNRLLLRTGTIELDILGLTPAAVVSYDYLGVGRVVGTSMPITTGVDVHKNLYDGAGDYTRIDNFGRITTDLWERVNSGTPTAIMDRTIAYDAVGNIKHVDHNIFALDRKYTLDGLYRLTDDDRGTLDSFGNLTATYQQHGWTYDALGNQKDSIRDFAPFGNTPSLTNGELGRVSEYDPVNALLNYDNDGTGTSAAQKTTSHDAVGNLTDDGETLEYEYDVFGRMVATNVHGTSAPLTEYRYNGVGQRIAWRWDNETMPDGSLDADDTWVYVVYDEWWRLLAEYESTTGGTIDDTPSTQWLHHHAGLSGRGGSSYIDALVLVDVDEDDDTLDTLETRRRYVQNWRYDVVAMLDTNGSPTTWIDYTAYGQALATNLRADFDGDGDVDTTDLGTFGAAFGSSSGDPNYNPAADFDSDGDVDLTDFGTFSSQIGTTAGPEPLPSEAAGRGYAGYVQDAALVDVYHVRNRVYLAEHGRWSRRDPIGYVDSASAYLYVNANSVTFIDMLGLYAAAPGDPSDPIVIPGNPGDIEKFPIRPLPPWRDVRPNKATSPAGIFSYERDLSDNCLGYAFGQSRWLIWPYGGVRLDNGMKNLEQWGEVISFVPDGCIEVSCDGVGPDATRCPGEYDREMIVTLQRYITSFSTQSRAVANPLASKKGREPQDPTINGGFSKAMYALNFHAIIRNPNASRWWDAKVDARATCGCITNLQAHFDAAYPATGSATTVPGNGLTPRFHQRPPYGLASVQRCFCCKARDMQFR